MYSPGAERGQRHLLRLLRYFSLGTGKARTDNEVKSSHGISRRAAQASPTIASVTPAVVEKGQSTEIGTVAPGLAGDTLTLKQTGGGGALALQLVGGVEEVIYTAPATVAASTLDAVSYTVTDQLGGRRPDRARFRWPAAPAASLSGPPVMP